MASVFSRWRASIGTRFGHAPSMVMLGALYEIDPGGAAGLSRANELYRQAAELGNAQAMCNLGINFLATKGGETDNEQAIAWLEKAAERHQPMACWALGKMHLLGRIVDKNVGEGMALLRRAANAGSTAAAVSLADIYKHGKHGIGVDETEAQRWAIASRPWAQRLAIKLKLARVNWPEQPQ